MEKRSVRTFEQYIMPNIKDDGANCFALISKLVRRFRS